MTTKRRKRNVPHSSDFPALRRERRRREMTAERSGTNGSWSAEGAMIKPPLICSLFDDLNRPDELPEAVFGQYPKQLLRRIVGPLLRCERHEVLHVCSGALRPGEGIRVDIRPEARPDILADGRRLPLANDSVAAVLIDPPYTPQYAADLYNVEYPRPSHLLAEAARVVRPCGRIGFVHYLMPMPPPRCSFVTVKGLSTGFGFPMRALTVFQKEQDRLL